MYKKVIEGYLGGTDWRHRENANVSHSLGGLILHNSGAMTANYWLKQVYPAEIAEAHESAAFHIHDLGMYSAYCAGWSLRQLIQEGLGGVEGKITSAPAKHLATLVNQMVNFLGVMQNEWAGAQAFSSFDTYLAAFVRAEGLTQTQVDQCIQSFVYGINIPSRWGTQAPFSNITLDWTPPEDLKNKKAIVGGEEQDFTYGELQREMDLINNAFLRMMISGDAEGRGFQYPIPTYNITKDFIWDSENAKLLFEMTSKYGTPYFQNFINSDLNPGDVRSMCCRLQLDKRELRKRGGGLFGSDEFTGSLGVVTINLPQLAYLHRGDKEGFFAALDRLMDLASESLVIKRKVITDLLEGGLFPYTKRYLAHLNNHFNTIGINGGNECCLNFLGKDITSKEGYAFIEEILLYMRDKMSYYQEQTGQLYNLEATPAESTSLRLALHDKKNYPSKEEKREYSYSADEMKKVYADFNQLLKEVEVYHLTSGTKHFINDKEYIVNLQKCDDTYLLETSYCIEKGIIASGDADRPFYTNSSQLPVDYTSDIFDAMDHQEKLQKLYTGGTVVHLFLGENIKHWQATRDLVQSVLTSYKIPYLTLSPTYSICSKHGYLSGEQWECPLCQAEKAQLEKQLVDLREQLSS